MKVQSTILILLVLLLGGVRAWSCTSYLITKGATHDGCTMVSYVADSHTRYGELYFLPRANWPAGSMVTLYDRGTAKPLGQVPQVPHTYQVVGFMNEHQVAIGESTFDGRPELHDTTGIVDYGSLMFLALQRARTAREAIRVMVELVEQYGYASTGESFSIGDPKEVWILEMIGKGIDLQYDKKSRTRRNASRGAVWVARRIPNGYISAHANQARITQFQLSDGAHSISSQQMDKLFLPSIEVVYAHDVIDFARKKGYFQGEDKDFSFADAYAPLTFGAMRFCEMRVWTMFNRLANGMDAYWGYAQGLDTVRRLPLYVKPNRKLTPQDLFACMRDWLQGTELDMSRDAGAGPFGLPYRWRPLTWTYGGDTYFNERATATQQTGFSFVAQMRSWMPDALGGILWFGVDDVSTTLHMPIYTSITRPPQVLASGNGDMLRYSKTAAFWTFNRVAHFAYLFYNRVQPDIRAVQTELEDRFAAFIPAIDVGAARLWASDTAQAVAFLTDFSVLQANAAVARWDELANYLLVKYLDGNVKQEGKDGFLRNPWGNPMPPQFPGYDEAWKAQVVRDAGSRLKEPAR